MKRLIYALALVASPALAQSTAEVAHRVPFTSTGNNVELELATSDGTRLNRAEVTVASAPNWLRFHTVRAEATASDDAAPVARLTFDVLRPAPVGEPAEVVFDVWAGGIVVATHAVRLVVSAPELALDLPRPNPARGAVAVPFTVSEAGRVHLAAYDMLGREVAVLVDEERSAGAHDARIDTGAWAAGVYVLRLATAGGESRVRRVTVVR